MRYSILVAQLLWASLCLSDAPPPRPADYLANFELKLEADAPLYSAVLSAAVYQHSNQASLADIAVFNAANKQVPHYVRATPSEPQEQTPRIVALPFFPIPTAKMLHTVIMVGGDGNLVRATRAQALDDTAPVSNFIVDASAVAGKLDAIELAIADELGSVDVEVEVQAAADLDHWRTIMRRQRIAKLEYQGHELKQLRIELGRRKDLYYRLILSKGLAIDELQAIRGVIHAAGRQELHVETLTVSAIDNLPQTDFKGIVFDLGGKLPVRALELELQANQLFEANVESSSQLDGEWRSHQRATFYALERDGLVLRPSKLPLLVNDGRFWRLQNLRPDRPAAAIRLRVHWQAQSVVFLREGEGPFVLAVGLPQSLSERLSGDFSATLRKLESYDVGGIAHLGEMRAQAQTQPRAWTSLPWQRIVLWTVLVIALGIGALMVMSLLKQMRTP